VRFPARELKGFCDYLKPGGVGRVYFRVQFLDDKCLVLELLPRVFIGRNLFPSEEGGASFLYFREVDCSAPPDVSTPIPTQWDSAEPSGGPSLEREEEGEYRGVLEFEAALDELFGMLSAPKLRVWQMSEPPNPRLQRTALAPPLNRQVVRRREKRSKCMREEGSTLARGGGC
jgi:hypothetical protein